MAINRTYVDACDADLASTNRVVSRCLQIVTSLRGHPSSATPAQLLQAVDLLLSAVSTLSVAIGHLSVGHRNER